MLESRLKEIITKKLTKEGWLVISLIQTSFNGIPDKMVIRQGRVVFLEFKRPGINTMDPVQEYRREQFQAAGVEVYLVNDIHFEIPKKL